MRPRFVIAAAGVSLLAAGVSPLVGQGQNPPPQAQPRNQSARQEIPAFRSRVTLVPLDVRVLDRDGKYRKVEVKVNRPGVTVLVRSGYYPDDVIVPSDRAAFIMYQRLADVGRYQDNVRDLALTLKASQAKSTDKKTPGDVMVDLRIDASRIGFEPVEGRHVAKLEVRVYCSDAHEKIVGEVASTVGLNLTEDSYRKYLQEGVPYTARVAVKAAARYVKVVVYDTASDLAGSTVTRLK